MQPHQVSDGRQVETKQAECMLRIWFSSAAGYPLRHINDIDAIYA